MRSRAAPPHPRIYRVPPILGYPPASTNAITGGTTPARWGKLTQLLLFNHDQPFYQKRSSQNTKISLGLTLRTHGLKCTTERLGTILGKVKDTYRSGETGLRKQPR